MMGDEELGLDLKKQEVFLKAGMGMRVGVASSKRHLPFLSSWLL
jgi:hypothetical protein